MINIIDELIKVAKTRVAKTRATKTSAVETVSQTTG